MAKGNAAQPGGQVAGDAGDAPGVGPVGLDREVEDDVGLDPERRRQPDVTASTASIAFATSFEHEDPRVVVGEAELRGPSRASRSTTTPFILPVGRSRIPPGSTAPTGARGTRSPTAKFHAPHTTSTGPLPASTTTRRIRSAPGMAAISSTRATTSRSRPSPTLSIPSTTSPRSSRVGGQFGRVALDGREVPSHDSGTRTDVLSGTGHQNWRTKRRSFSIRNRISAIWWRICAQRSIPKPKAKPVHSVGIDAHCGEDRRIDHAAAAELDPTGLGAGTAPRASADGAGHLELGRRLGEREVGRAKARVDVGRRSRQW